MPIFYRLLILLMCLFCLGACSKSDDAQAGATGTPAHAHSPGETHKEGDKH